MCPVRLSAIPLFRQQPPHSGHMSGCQNMGKAGVEETTGLYLQQPIFKGHRTPIQITSIQTDNVK